MNDANGWAADHELVRSAVTGNRSVQRQLLVRVLPVVRRTVALWCRDENERDDAIQYSLVEILANLGRYRGEGTVEAWAALIARRTAWRLRRAARRAQDIIHEHAQMWRAHTDGFDETRCCGRIAALLTELPRAQRDAIILHHAYELSLTELAQATGVSTNTAKSRLSFGLRRLRSRLGV